MWKASRPADVIFLTYDEPMKDVYWDELKTLVPWAQRVDGVKGFDAAHKACALKARSSRFFIVDGDNRVQPDFLKIIKTPLTYHFSKAVFSWASRNSINGLVYGNGGIKNWSRQVLLTSKSHEAAESPEMATDFCFGIKYIQQSDSLSVAEVNQTPFQAFRAGFREGVKMCLIHGRRLPLTSSEHADEWLNTMARSNIERLKIWCSVGMDVNNGLWGIYGARLGCSYLLDKEWPHERVNDYHWFERFWQNSVAPSFAGFEKYCRLSRYSWSHVALKKACEDLGEKINKHLKLEISLLDEQQSRFFKSVYINRPRRRILDGTQSRSLH